MGLLKTTDPAITPAGIEAKMHLPPHMKAPFRRVVLAGLKVMFDEKSHQMMLKELAGPEPMPKKLGLGVAGLMALLFQEAQRSIPPQLLIPAGMVLLAHATEFVQKSGQPVSKQEFGEATQVMVDAILTAFKMDPAKIAKAGAPHV